MRQVLLGLILLCHVIFAPARSPVMSDTREEAIFAGGCFWCVEADFDKVPGVLETISGFDGGKTPNPTYKQVSSGATDYAEAVKVVFDPRKVSYRQLLKVFWHSIDPTVLNRQFCDVGKQYRTAIFYLNDTQKEQALASLKEIKGSLNDEVYTEIVPSTYFYSAEEYHQNYHKKNPLRYKFYRTSCGRDARLRDLWKKD